MIKGCFSCIGKAVLIILVLVWIFAVYQEVNGQELSTPTYTPEPTETTMPTALPTETTMPTALPTETTMPTALPTETPTPEPPTFTPTAVIPTPTPTPLSTSTPVPGDAYENDTPPNAPIYIGPQLRSFYPENDIDYVRYRLKASITTYFETHDLVGEADTFVCVYRDDDGYLTEHDALLGCDDDSGFGLSSYLTLSVSADMDVTITIENQAIGYAPPVGYSFRIVAEPNATPTVTPRPPTSTPRGNQQPTAYPTYTPYPTVTAVPVTPAPTTPPMPASSSYSARPAATAAPKPILYVYIYTDTNEDHVMDGHEGADDVRVILSTLDRQWQMEVYAVDGMAAFIAGDDFPAGHDEVLVRVPYLHRNGTFKLDDEQATTAEIALEPVVYPVYLP